MCGNSFKQTHIPFTIEYFVPIKFDWNWPCGSGEEVEKVKSLQTDGWEVISNTHKLSAKVEYKSI